MAYSDAQRTNNSSRSVKTFSDLNLNFTRNPATGDVARLTDIEAVKRAVRNLVLTNQYNQIADMNEDNLLNVVDIVQLVNLIIS